MMAVMVMAVAMTVLLVLVVAVTILCGGGVVMVSRVAFPAAAVMIVNRVLPNETGMSRGRQFPCGGGF